jgi:hypothetical protein
MSVNPAVGRQKQEDLEVVIAKTNKPTNPEHQDTKNKVKKQAIAQVNSCAIHLKKLSVQNMLKMSCYSIKKRTKEKK